MSYSLQVIVATQTERLRILDGRSNPSNEEAKLTAGTSASGFDASQFLELAYS